VIKRGQRELILEALCLLEKNTKTCGQFRTDRSALEAALKKNYQRLDEIYREIKALNFRGLQLARSESLKDLRDKPGEVGAVEKV